MSEYKIEIQDSSICLKLSNNKQTGCAVHFIGMAGLIIFLLPPIVLVLLLSEITFGTVIVFVVSWLISGYLFRIYLWNKYGKEVFIIKQGQLRHYNDYKLYKDNLGSFVGNKLDVLYFIENIGYSINDLKFLDKLLINS